MEALVCFPVPEFIKEDFSDIDEYGLNPACLCYQYNITEYGNGPVGFRTKQSREFLAQCFGVLYELRLNTLSFYEGCAEGLNLFGDNPENEKIRTSLLEYKKAKLKYELMKKRGADVEAPIPHFLTEFYSRDSGKMSGRIIRQLLTMGCDFIVSHVVHDSFITFDPTIIDRVSAVAKEMNIRFSMLSSREEMNNDY
jgi:hypothetical protein